MHDDPHDRERNPDHRVPPAIRNRIERVEHPDVASRGSAKRGGIAQYRYDTDDEHPGADYGRAHDGDVADDGEGREGAKHASDHEHERRRLAAEEAPAEIEGERRQGGADQTDADEVRRNHEERAENPANGRGEYERPRARGAHPRCRDHRAEDEPEHTEHEPEEPVAREARQQSAHRQHGRCWHGVRRR